jgi:hypothetical protein
MKEEYHWIWFVGGALILYVLYQQNVAAKAATTTATPSNPAASYPQDVPIF